MRLVNVSCWAYAPIYVIRRGVCAFGNLSVECVHFCYHIHSLMNSAAKSHIHSLMNSAAKSHIHSLMIFCSHIRSLMNSAAKSHIHSSMVFLQSYT
jgi:hypothetical protein